MQFTHDHVCTGASHTHWSLLFFYCTRRWLRRQAQLFAKGRLSEQQQEMLSRVGVCLQVPSAKVTQYVQLQVRPDHSSSSIRMTLLHVR
jgi:hypothetical protein